MSTLTLIGFALLAGVEQSAPPAPFSPIAIEINESATVKGTKFNLGEVIQVSGENTELIEKINKIPVGYSPAPGYERKLLKASVADLLYGSGISKNEVQVTGAVYVSVRTESMFLDTDQLVLEGEKWVRQQLASRKIEDYQLETKARPLALQVPVGKSGVKLDPVLRGHFRERGQVNLELHVMVDGEIYSSVPLSFAVHRYASAAVAARGILPNESLDTNNVNFRRILLPEGVSEPVLEEAQFHGRKSSRLILEGEVITNTDLKVVPMVLRDEEVAVVVRSGALTITLRGIAKSDGYFGAIIPVLNVDSQKQIQAKVVSAGRVEINVPKAR